MEKRFTQKSCCTVAWRWNGDSERTCAVESTGLLANFWPRLCSRIAGLLKVFCLWLWWSGLRFELLHFSKCCCYRAGSCWDMLGKVHWEVVKSSNLCCWLWSLQHIGFGWWHWLLGSLCFRGIFPSAVGMCGCCWSIFIFMSGMGLIVSIFFMVFFWQCSAYTQRYSPVSSVSSAQVDEGWTLACLVCLSWRESGVT